MLNAFMSSVRKTLLEILETQPDMQIGMTKLAKELIKRRALGFGVEPEDVVSALMKENKVSYDSKKDIVYKIKKEIDYSI